MDAGPRQLEDRWPHVGQREGGALVLQPGARTHRGGRRSAGVRSIIHDGQLVGRRGAGLLAQQRAGEGQRHLCVVVVQLGYLWNVGICQEDFASPACKLFKCGKYPQMV